MIDIEDIKANWLGKEGIFNVYKPKGVSSFYLVAKIRRLTGIKKVGHAGTLDPLAEGVLVVAVGRNFTKQLSKLVEKEKEYIAEIKLGQISATDDEEGAKTVRQFAKRPTQAEVKKYYKNLLEKFNKHHRFLALVKFLERRLTKKHGAAKNLIPERTVF